MARYGTLKRNIKRNIKSWSADDTTRVRGDIVVASKLFAVFIALSLAASFVPLMAKVVFSIPDVYDFDLGRTKAVETIGASVDDGSIADEISSFMRHKTDILRVEAKDDDQPGLLFTASDVKAMTSLRSFLDNILIIGLTSLAVFIALSILLVRWNRPRDLKYGFVCGFVLYGALLGALAAAIVFKWPPAMKVWTDVIGARFMPGDTIPQLFQSGFFLVAWIVMTAVTLAIMLVLASVIGRLAGREGMFLNRG
jgi:hypothetical protein